MSIFRRKKVFESAEDFHERVAEVRSADPYAEYDRIVNEVIDKTRRMAHCDQWVLHAPGACEYCDMYPELQEARVRLNINFTGKPVAGGFICPAEKLRPLAKIERWHGNIPMTTEQKRRDEEYWREFNAHMQQAFPGVDWGSV